LVFPELSLTGYVLQDITSTVARRPDKDEPVFRSLLEASHNLDMVVGFVDEDRRHRFYISSAYLSRGEGGSRTPQGLPAHLRLVRRRRFFAWGDRVQAFDTRLAAPAF